MTWLVAHIAPRITSVWRNLYEGGHGPYVPEYLAETIFRGEKKQVRKPLFPGYCFIRYTHRWPEAHGIKGVHILVYTNEDGTVEPHVLPDDFMDRIRVSTETTAPEQFAPGQWVRIKAGAWTGFFATVKRQKFGTAILDIDFMNRTVPISIPLHQLERIGDHPRGRPLPAQKPDMQSA